MGLPRLKLDIRIDKMRAGAGTRVRLPCVLWLAPVTWRPLSFTSYQVGGGSITPLEREFVRSYHQPDGRSDGLVSDRASWMRVALVREFRSTKSRMSASRTSVTWQSCSASCGDVSA